MQGTLNLPWSTSTLVRMLPVAKKQPLPTTNVSGSVTCREQTRKLPNYKMCSSSLWLQDCVSVNACGHFEKKLKEYEYEETGSLGVIDFYSFMACYCGWKRNHLTPKFLFKIPNLQAHGTSVSKGGTTHPNKRRHNGSICQHF